MSLEPPQCRRVAGILAVLGMVLVTVAIAAKAQTGSIAVESAWARATPKGAKVAAGYLTIKNNGAEPDRLVSARAEFAGNTEIHLMNMVDGVMQMRPVTDGLAIPPSSKVTLEPNAYHLMFMDLTGPLAEGETVSAELIFERAGKVRVDFQVMGLGAQRLDAKTHQHHHR